MKFSKERNFNKMKNKKIGAEEITLAPTTEIYNEAHKIALETTTEEKFPFVLDYDANEKETLLSMLNEVGAEIEKDSATHASISVRMNMTQLKLVKGLDCVIRVRTHRYNDRSLIKGEKKLISEDFTNIDVESDITNSDENSGDIAVMSLRSSPSSGVTEENFDGGGEVGESNLHLSDSEMASAKEINIGDSVDGCICCPGAEKYFKFKVIDQGIYTIYTTSDLDTVGHLYDSNGDLIVSVDDHEPGGEINFRIVRTLAANSTYYIKVHLRNNDTGEYTLRITDDILPNSVTITPGTITLKHGVTYELPITPNYTYKGYNGAQRIPGLSVSISPSNANEQKIWWWEQAGDVLKCSYGWDDDGDRYIHVTATGIGTAKLYAEDWNENGKRDECEVTCNTPGMDSTPEHSHIYHAVLSEDRDEYTFTCISSQCDDSFTVPKDQVVGSYVTSNTDPRLGNSQTPLVYGIDLSSYQGEISQGQWNDIANTKLNGQKITFVILRIGREKSNNPDGSINRVKDECFDENYIRAKAAGLHVGCYYLTESWSPQNAIADAEQVIEWIGDKQFEYPIFFDIESTLIEKNVSDKATRTKICTSFMNKMREEGFFTGFYTYDNWMDKNLNESTLLPEYDFWYARWYDDTPNNWGANGEDDWAGTGRKFGMWQYAEKQPISPISEKVDYDVAYKNYPLIIKALHLNNF